MCGSSREKLQQRRWRVLDWGTRRTMPEAQSSSERKLDVVKGQATTQFSLVFLDLQTGLRQGVLRISVEVCYLCPRCGQWHSKLIEPEDRALNPPQHLHLWRRRCPLLDGEIYIVRLSDRQLRRAIAGAERLIGGMTIERRWLSAPPTPIVSIPGEGVDDD